MAESTANKAKAAANCNFVALDRIWKDHVGLEENACKTWPRDWGFLTTKYEDLVKDEFPNRKKKKKDRKPATLIQIRPVTPVSEYIKVLPSPRPVPRTTASEVGWRSTVSDLRLEKYGGYAKPKGGLIRQLNWPTEAIN